MPLSRYQGLITPRGDIAVISRALAAIALLCVPTLSPAADAFTSDIPPFSIEQGPRVGFVREIVTEVGKRVGVNVMIVYGNSWPKSQEEAKSRPDTLIFPLARTKAREPDYQWVFKVIDADVAFATAPGRPKVETDAAARALKGIGVRDGSPMVKDLQGRGYTNLVILKTSTDNARALQEGKIDAWYAPAPEIAFNWIELKLPGAPAFGLKLDSAPIYVAASKNTPGIDLAKWRATFAAMEKDGMHARILGAYGL
jgi:polar amino acid transport system substrate-binding protein